MDTAIIIGLLATACIVVSQVPQVYKSVKSHKTRDLSLAMIALLLVGSFLWLTYGFVRPDYIIVFSNSIITTCLFILLAVKLRYK